MADEIDYEIIGEDFHAVVITLDPGEAVQAEPGALMFMEDEIDMGTSTGGGLLSGLKRKIAGERFFVTRFENEGSTRRQVAFASEHPGNVRALALAQRGRAEAVGRRPRIRPRGRPHRRADPPAR